MRRLPRPTQWAMDQASSLGRTMALEAPGVIPQLHFAHEYPDYVEFIQAHRQCVERLPAYNSWDERLQGLCEREGRALGLDLEDSFEWDDFYLYIAVPMHATFWWSWEKLWRVQDLHRKWNKWYEARRPKEETVQRVLHVFMTGLKQHVEGEKDSWEAITNRLFEQGDAGAEEDEAFWALPEAERIGTKAEGR